MQVTRAAEFGNLTLHGRNLAWEDAGDPQDLPILYCHGTLGSRLQPAVFIADEALRRNRIRMITRAFRCTQIRKVF